MRNRTLLAVICLIGLAAALSVSAGPRASDDVGSQVKALKKEISRLEARVCALEKRLGETQRPCTITLPGIHVTPEWNPKLCFEPERIPKG